MPAFSTRPWAVETPETDAQVTRRRALDGSLADYERRGFQIESRTNTQAVVVRWPGISRFRIRHGGTRLVIWVDEHGIVETRQIEARRW
jgi:hypothetical protein